MAAKAKFCLALVLISFLVLCACVARATRDPEKSREREREQCVQRCDEYYRQKKDREREQGGGQEGEEWSVEENGKKQLRDCRRWCVERFGQGEEEEEEPWRGGERVRNTREEREKEDQGEKEEESEEGSEEEGEEGKSRNPYVFEERHFHALVKTQEGRLSVLSNFRNRSELLRGIQNFRLGILQTNPRTLVVPHHWDADTVYVVLQGNAVITVIHLNRRNSINVDQGDIIKVPAGTPIYITNRDDNQKLYIAQLFNPVNTPGNFEVFQGAAGQDPESFLSAFSSEVLESALNVDKDRLQKMLSQQQEEQGSIVKLSRKQVERLSGQDEEGGLSPHWPFGPHSKGSEISSFNILNQRPSHTNQHGQLFEVDGDNYKPLQYLDLRISFANLTRGSMTVPYYNSRSTKIALVADGEGYFEMACPHLSQSSNQTYQRVRSRLRRGTVFIVPADHPVVVVSSENSTLEILCFEVNAEYNFRYQLAGKRNIFDQMHRVAKEVSFNLPGRDVERIFRKRDEEFFLPGPNKRQGRGYAAA